MPEPVDNKKSDYENLLNHLRKVLAKIPPKETGGRSEQSPKREDG